MRKNEARFESSRNKWQINVQADGERRSFVCAKKDHLKCRTTVCSARCTRGKIIAEKKADEWIENRTVNENTRCRIMLDRYVERTKQATGKGHHRQTESFVRLYIEPCIGHVRCGALSQNDCQGALDYAYSNPAKGEKLSKKTLMDIRACIMSFVKYCRGSNATKFHPETLTIPAGAKKSKKEILNIQDIVTLFTVDTTIFRGKRVVDRFIHLYRFRTVTGVRPGESIALKDSHISGTRITIDESINIYNELTHGKNDNAERTYTLDEHAVKIREDQRRMLMGLGQISPYVFPAENLDHATQNQVYKAWKRYCKVNGIKAISPYELRHTFVSVNTKMPDALKRLVMGHSENMDTQGIYGHEKADDMEDAAAYIKDAFKKILGW